MKLKNQNFDGVYHLKNEAYKEEEKPAEKPKKRRKKGEK